MPIRFEGLRSEPIRSVTVNGEEVPCVVAPQEDDSNNFVQLNDTSSDTASVTTTEDSFVVTSSAAFTSADVGKEISGTGIPDNAIVVTFTSTSSITFRTPPTEASPHGQPATASGTITATLRDGFAGTYTRTRANGVVRQSSIVSLALAENDQIVLGRAGISSTTYDILVDLSDTTNFPHLNTARIDLEYLKIAIDPASNSVGAVRLGVITRIDGTDADIDFAFNVPFGKTAGRILSINMFSPNQMKLGVQSGSWIFGLTNRSETDVTAVNTGVTLDSPRGSSTVTPAVGDVIVKYLHTSGSAWDSLLECFYHSHVNVTD